MDWEMAKAYYSAVFDQPAAQVWKIVRDFNNHPAWVGRAAGESRIEDGKSGNTVGAIRSVLIRSGKSGIGCWRYPMSSRRKLMNSVASLRFRWPIFRRPWWATFDCDVAGHDEPTGILRGGIGKWWSQACPQGFLQEPAIGPVSDV
jgi:hypothetical protein